MLIQPDQIESTQSDTKTTTITLTASLIDIRDDHAEQLNVLLADIDTVFRKHLQDSYAGSTSALAIDVVRTDTRQTRTRERDWL